MEQRLKKIINGAGQERFMHEFCVEACTIGVANSEMLIPAFKRTVEQKRKVTQVLEFLKDFEISEMDVIDLQIYIKKQRGLGDISAACCFQIFDFQGERFCYLFNLKVDVTGQGVGSRLFASIKTAVEYEILNWEYNSLFPEKQAPPQIVHYLASVSHKMPADGFYVKQGFLLQDDDVEPWAHQDGLQLYHLERQPNQMSQRSVFKFFKKAATIINQMQTNEEEKQEDGNQIQMLQQQQNTPMISSVQVTKQQHAIDDKLYVLGVNRATTNGRKKKHCRECKKAIAEQNWAKHVTNIHDDADPGFSICTEKQDCVFCKGKYYYRAYYGSAYYGSAYYGSAYYGSAYYGSAYYGSAYYGSAYYGSAYYGSAYYGSAYYGSAYNGSAQYGSAYYDTPTKTTKNQNRQYICQVCPNSKPVRVDAPQGKSGKCYKCGTSFVVTSSKSVICALTSRLPIQASDSVSNIGKRPAPTTLEMLQSQINGNNSQDGEEPMSQQNDMNAIRNCNCKVGEYLAKQDLFQQSLVSPSQIQQSTLSRDTVSMQMPIQVDTKLLSTSAQVVDRLQVIEKSARTLFASVTAAQSVQSLCSLFLDKIVYNYMEQAVTHVMLREAVKEVQQRTLKLNTKQAAGILFASFVLGGDCLPGAIKSMLTLRSSGSFENVFSLLMAAINSKYGEVLGRWIGLHWEFMTSTHLNVMSNMRSTLTKSDVNLLTLLMIVTVSSSQELQVLVQFISDINDEQEYEHILNAIEKNPNQPGITQQQLFELIVILQNNQFYSTLEHLSDDLLQINIIEWATTIKNTHQQLAILNASSAQQFIGELRGQMGEIHPLLVDDFRQRDRIIRLMFKSIKSAPNERQFAVAQYALGLSYTQQRQMWVVPSGQGKSRIIATLAYLALKSGMYTKVEIIFSNEDLMKRDRSDFADMWSYFPSADISYQVGIPSSHEKDGEHTPVLFSGALVIVDEADAIMYDNPSMFHKYIQGNCCVAYTATPDDGDDESIEQTILDHMSFKRFDYIAVENYLAEVQINSVSSGDKVKYVINQLSIGPVLLLCDESLAAMILSVAGEQNCVHVCPGVDYQVLRTLDQKVGQLYRVALCVNEFGIRGIDYRSPNAQLTLAIARSFVHKRDYLQGVKRVGRFNDQSIIVRFEDVPLVDTESEQQYKAKLFQFCAALLGKGGAVQLKAAKINKVPVAAGKVKVPSLAQKMEAGGVYKSGTSRLQRLLEQPGKISGQQTTLNFIKPIAAASNPVILLTLIQHIQQRKE